MVVGCNEGVRSHPFLQDTLPPRTIRAYSRTPYKPGDKLRVVVGLNVAVP